MAERKSRKARIPSKPRGPRNSGRPRGRPGGQKNKVTVPLLLALAAESEKLKAAHPEFSDAEISRQIKEHGIPVSGGAPMKKWLPSAETIRKRLPAARREALKLRPFAPSLPEPAPQPAEPFTGGLGLLAGLGLPKRTTD